MRRIEIYIYQKKAWPNFTWNQEELAFTLGKVRHLQGKIMGKMEALGFHLREEAVLETLTLDVLKSSEIEGELLSPEQVRSSIARHLGMDISGLVRSDRNVDGVVEMMLDATQQNEKRLSAERLYSWHASLFPTGRSGMYKIKVGKWRDDASGPMQVISGALEKEKVHFEAPQAKIVNKEMNGMLTNKFFRSERYPFVTNNIPHFTRGFTANAERIRGELEIEHKIQLCKLVYIFQD